MSATAPDDRLQGLLDAGVAIASGLELEAILPRKEQHRGGGLHEPLRVRVDLGRKRANEAIGNQHGFDLAAG